MVKFKDFSRPLSMFFFQVLFKANLIFKDLGPRFLGCRTFCASKPLPYNVQNMVTDIQAKDLPVTFKYSSQGSFTAKIGTIDKL